MTNPKNRRLSLVLALATFVPLPLLAAGTATIDNGEEVNNLYWQDAQTVRMDMSAESSYMLLRDGKTYIVDPDADASMPPVMEVGAMMRGMVDAFADDEEAASPLLNRIESVKKTGKTETIAGIKGDVYEAVSRDRKGQAENTQLVLTSDPLVVEMTEAYLAYSASMLGPERIAEIRNALPKGKRGLLRAGDDMVVQAVSKDKPAADMFELPAEPVNFGDMMKHLMEQAQQPQN